MKDISFTRNGVGCFLIGIFALIGTPHSSHAMKQQNAIFANEPSHQIYNKEKSRKTKKKLRDIVIVFKCEKQKTKEIVPIEEIVPTNDQTGITIQWLKTRLMYRQDYKFSKNTTDKQVIAYVKKNPYLEIIDLSALNQVGDVSVIAIAKGCRWLREIILDGGINGEKYTDKSIQILAEHCKHLVSISLNGCSELTGTSIIKLAEFRKNLRKINLAFCFGIRKNINGVVDINEVVECIAKYCKNLTHIDLTFHNELRDSSVKLLAENCNDLTFIKLEHNNLNCSHIGNLSLQSLAKHCKHLTYINLSGVKSLADDDIIVLSEGCLKLREVILDYCSKLTDKSVVSLTKHCKNLTTIGLACCHELTDVSIESIVKYSQNLTSIDADYCRKLTNSVVKKLAYSCGGLEVIRFAGCDLKNDSIKAFASNCKNLKEINIVGCFSVEDESIQCLEHCSHLRRLQVQDRSIYQKTEFKLKQALPEIEITIDNTWDED